MKIYTKTGDTGETSLFGGGRVPKDHLRIEAYGTVDELNSILGVCRSLEPHPEVDILLQQLQNDLFVLGADLATKRATDPARPSPSRVARILPDDISRLEHAIDRIDQAVTPLTAFILPGGTQAAAMMHLARTVCRRAERFVVTLAGREDIGEGPVIYLNRLSDLLFMMARWENALRGKKETEWRGGTSM